jgi:cell wall assembly regulator SMI1
MDHLDEKLWAAVLEHARTDLEPPATEEALAAFEALHGFRLPPAHRAFLLRANGGCAGSVLLFGVGRDDALDLGGNVSNLRPLFESMTERSVLPFAKDWGGSYFCYDLWRPGPAGDWAVVCWNHQYSESTKHRAKLWSECAPDFLGFVRTFIAGEEASPPDAEEPLPTLEWDAQTDPLRMLSLVRGRTSPRQLRLFAASCARRVVPLLHNYDWPDPGWGSSVPPALEVVERFLAGRATRDEVAAADFDAFACEDFVAWTVAYALAACRNEGPIVQQAAESASKCAVEACGQDAYRKNVEQHGVREVSFGSMRMTVPNRPGNEDAVRAAELAAQAALLRDLFGNPFRPPSPDPRWLTRAVVDLARAIAEEQRYDDLLVLADALEEAGCDDPALLAHCRKPREHVRGCWVLELLAGRSP